MIIPAIDLMHGRVVRLRQGDFSRSTVFDVDPLTRIRQAWLGGASMMHLVDLDGARNPRHRQIALIRALTRASPLPIQTGGGVRSWSDVRSLLDAGVARVVIGSHALLHPELVRGWLRHFSPERITLACDVSIRDGVPCIATHGWQRISDVPAAQLLRRYLPCGLRHVLITDIARDGMMQGANQELYRSLARTFPQLDIIASGGIASLEDIRSTARSGAAAVVLGRALLEGRFTVREAIRCWQSA